MPCFDPEKEQFISQIVCEGCPLAFVEEYADLCVKSANPDIQVTGVSIKNAIIAGKENCQNPVISSVPSPNCGSGYAKLCGNSQMDVALDLTGIGTDAHADKIAHQNVDTPKDKNITIDRPGFLGRLANRLMYP